MQKTLLLNLVLLAALVLAACGPVAAGGAAQAGNGTAANGTPSANREMPLTVQLALGTFKLEETDYPITAEQAQKLLPLWKAARSLGRSDTSATQEIDAVVKQIQKTLTPEQTKAIQEMKLTFQDMGAIAQKLGIEIGRGGGFGNLSPEMQATAQAARQSGRSPQGGGGGGFPGGPGGPPGGGPGGFGGGGQSLQQTAVARGGGRRASLGVNPALLDAVIKFLEAKTQ
jgi:hypothetical protein